MKRSFGEKYDDYKARIRTEALMVKNYLQGKFVRKGNRYTPTPQIKPVPNVCAEFRRERKKRNKMAYRSRRINRKRILGVN